jgi:hypothetical protein
LWKTEDGTQLPEQQSPVNQSNRVNYPDLLTFIEGSLVGFSDSVENAEQDIAEIDRESTAQPNIGSSGVAFPSLRSIAQDGSHGKNWTKNNTLLFRLYVALLCYQSSMKIQPLPTLWDLTLTYWGRLKHRETTGKREMLLSD